MPSLVALASAVMGLRWIKKQRNASRKARKLRETVGQKQPSKKEGTKSSKSDKSTERKRIHKEVMNSKEKQHKHSKKSKEALRSKEKQNTYRKKHKFVVYKQFASTE